MEHRFILAAAHPLLADHRLEPHALLSAAHQIDLILQSRDVGTGRQVILERLAFLKPALVLGATTVARVEGRPANGVALIVNEAVCARSSVGLKPLEPPAYVDLEHLGSSGNLKTFEQWRESECAMSYGAAYRAIHALSITEHEGNPRAVARLRTPGEPDPREIIPPALIDSVFQLLAFLSKAPKGGGMPWTITSIVTRRPVRGALYAVVDLISRPHNSNVTRASAVTGNARLITDQGEVVVELTGVTMMAPPLTAGQQTKTRAGGLVASRTWTRPCSPGPAGQSVVTLEVGEPIDGSTPVTQRLAHFAAELRDNLVGEHREPAIRLITRNAVARAGTPADPFQAAVAGMLPAVRSEHASSTIQWIDLPREGIVPAGIPDLLESNVAWIDNHWTCPESFEHTDLTDPPLLNGTYLITGSFGGIGQALARHLAMAGARRITMLSRKEPSQEHRQLLSELSELCEVDHRCADMTDLDLDLSRSNLPYDAIFHTAGVLKDRLFAATSLDQIEQVMAPKSRGLEPLLRYSEVSPDTRVLLFSSIAVVEGHIGQAVYGAANAYQDCVAEAMCSRGRPWYSLRWGLWSLGMGSDIHDAAALNGYPVLDAAQGLRLLDDVLGRAPGIYELVGDTTAATTHQHRPGSQPTSDVQEDTTMSTLASNPIVQPPAPTAQTLCVALATVLAQDEVRGDDSPTDLGLDSMLAVEVSAHLAVDGYEIEPAALFTHDTVAAIAEALGWPTSTESLAGSQVTHAPLPASLASPAFTETRPDRNTVSAAAQEPLHGNWVKPARALKASSVWDQFRDHEVVSRPQVTHPDPEPPLNDAEQWPQPQAEEQAPSPRGPSACTATTGLARSLPNRLTLHPQPSSFEATIDDLSAEDRGLVASGNYFYEPVVDATRGSNIKVAGRWMLNFASYSYLGLIGNQFITQRAMREMGLNGTGAHGVRLLAGTATVHRQLEQCIARFLGHEDAVVFSSGYMANVATIAAMANPDSVILGDVYNHASILDGYRLSGGTVIPYAHNDMRDLERGLRKVGGRRSLVVTDAVFSMDGDVADLPKICHLAREYGAALMVDEAHSLGVLGATGRGVTEHFNMDPRDVDISMGTLSKTIPSAGGYVAGSNDLVFALKNNARGWMFSAALPPAQAAAALAALELIEVSSARVGTLRKLSETYRDELRRNGFDTMKSQTPVVPIRCDNATQTLDMARICQDMGLFVQPITYPTVPKNSPRLRTIVNLSHTESDIARAIEVFTAAGRRVGVIP